MKFFRAVNVVQKLKRFVNFAGIEGLNNVRLINDYQANNLKQKLFIIKYLLY